MKKTVRLKMDFTGLCCGMFGFSLMYFDSLSRKEDAFFFFGPLHNVGIRGRSQRLKASLKFARTLESDWDTAINCLLTHHQLRFRPTLGSWNSKYCGNEEGQKNQITVNPKLPCEGADSIWSQTNAKVVGKRSIYLKLKESLTKTGNTGYIGYPGSIYP